MAFALFGAVASDHSTPVDALVGCAEAMLADLPDVAHPGTPANDILTFGISTFTAEALQGRGEPVGPGVFLHRAIAADESEADWSVAPGHLRLWTPMSDLLDLALLEATLRYLAVFYAHAWRRPEYDDLAEALWAYASEAVVTALGVTDSQLEHLELDHDALLMWAMHSALHRIQWASRSERRDAREEFSVWEPLLGSEELAPPLRKMLLSLPAFSDVPLTDRPKEELAEQLLAEFADDLSPPLELRAHCSACAGSKEQLLDRLPAIVAAAKRHRDFDYEHEGPVERSYSRSQAAVAISWAFRTLAEGGHIDEALVLLRAWIPDPPDGLAPPEPLIMMPTSVAGTRWVSRTELAPGFNDDQPDSLAELVAVVARAFGTTLTIRGDQPWHAPSGRTGIPVESEAPCFEQISRSHMRLDALAAIAPNISDDALLVPWPMLRIPVQAHTIRQLDRAWPISASLTEPAPTRELQKVVVMGRGSVTSSIERRAIGMCFERAGAEVIDIEEATFEAFRAIYEDPGVDAVWFCSHGSQDHARPHLSGLHLDDGEFATLSQLNALQLPPSERRRLLVLNVCDAGSSPMLEGPLSLGVAAVRLPGSSWNFGDDPHGLTVTR